MRLAYVAQDRVDLQYASKELARCMQEPTQWDLEQLNRPVRYFKGQPRQVQRFAQQAQPERLVVYTDSDFAGCLKTRRSTTCVMAFHGDHLLRGTSTTQAVVALSSGEAEFYAAVKGASIAIGIGSLCVDIGCPLKKHALLRVDSTACLGMAGRKGAGRVRHIHTPCLWLQQVVSAGRLELSKVLGTENPADLGTKALGPGIIQQAMAKCGFVSLAGKSRMALSAEV